ncbi:hypothetical protein [Methylorubrum populi]|uniref:hypothetical protein n=1 Tax=Methylorubrum populi TaxID=223967 RepID=UPI003F656A37
MSTAVKAAFAARHIYAVPATRFARLNRLGLLRRRAGGFDLDELREDLELVEEIEQRIAAVGGDLTPAERNGALAWLAALALSRTKDPATAGAALHARELIETLTRPS